MLLRRLFVVGFLVLAGCTASEDDSCSLAPTPAPWEDADEDGYPPEADCDDATFATNPAAAESCDAIDNNCDGITDGADAVDATTWYADTDGDGVGDDTHPLTGCEPPPGYVLEPGDCDDTTDTVNPLAQEITCDGVDQDCNGTDENDPVCEADCDGYQADSCGGTDCDDDDAAINPGAEDIPDNGVDENCDGADTTTADCDVDDDGFEATGCGGDDCDDTDPGINPSAADVWYDGVDSDCAGNDDFDQDEDGYVPTAYEGVVTEGVAGSGGLPGDDCDDIDAGANPGAAEIPDDGVDQDCDAADLFCDVDLDGYDVPSCGGDDCDDTDAAVNSGATETCNGIDDDCDGALDDADGDVVGATTYYLDDDADGYGGASVVACSDPGGTVGNDLDCDDTDASISPGSTELCDAADVDEDCDGLSDDDDPSVSGTSTWYPDADGDLYGDATGAFDACESPVGFVADDVDCNDTDAAVNPAATEICNGIDDDCDSFVDDDDSPVAGTSTWYADTDNDLYGDPSVSTDACAAPTNYVGDDTDCDDADATVNPGAAEVASDGADEDCDGEELCYFDADGDAYASTTPRSSSNLNCDGPDEVSDPAFWTDCDDTDASIYPGVCDVDCDGYVSLDSTGCGGDDCDDSDSGINPGAADPTADGVDQDCDGADGP